MTEPPAAGFSAQQPPKKTENPVSTRPTKTLNLSTIHSRSSNGGKPAAPETPAPETRNTEDAKFTSDQLKAAWMRFAETKKAYQAEYQLLMQPVELSETTVKVPINHPVQETLLHNLRSDLAAFLRTTLNNKSIQVVGEIRTVEEKEILYTNREKFEHLAKKNPMLNELKARLGLDTDF